MKVIVIGSGIVGASVAWHLADAGVDVVVADDGRVGRATWAGAGIVSAPGRRYGADTPGFELAAAAFRTYPSIVERLGLGNGAGEVWEVIGELHVAPPGRDLDEVGESLAALEADGLHAPGTVRRLDPAGTRALWPWLRPDLAAVYVASTGRVSGEAMRLALLRAAVARGAMVLTGPAALPAGAVGSGGAAVSGGGGWAPSRGPGTGGSAEVTVGGEVVSGDAVVVAAGAWSVELLRPLGVDLPVVPQRGQILHLSVAGVDTRLAPVVHPIGAEHYLLPFPDGRIVVGATRETGSGYDPRLTAGGVARVLNDALSVAPGLADATLVDLRVGLRPASPDGLPWLGPVPGRPWLWVATGMGPSGLTLGPYGGSLVSDALLGRPLAVDLAPFALDRRL